jgi:hypothetical protein
MLCALTTSSAPALSQQSESPCERLEGFHRLGFWLGEWNVHSGEALVGTNTIEKILNGCAIMEHWRGDGGTEGKSLFFYNHVSDTWKQVWVTQNATSPGGLKEKTLLPILADGSLRFQGIVTLEDGRSFLDRTTLSPLPGDRVRQVIEISGDEGATWQTRFDAIYSRPAREAPSG